MMHGGGGHGGRGNFDEDEILGKAYDARLMRRLLGYLRPYRGLVIVALLIILGISVTEAAPPVLAKFIVDNAIAPAVNGQIGLAVTVKVEPPYSDPSLNRLLEYSGRNRFPSPDHLAGEPDIDRDDAHRVLWLHLLPHLY